HDLVLLFLMLLARPPVMVVPRGFQVQPVDVRDVADRMATLALAEPAGRVPDLGGPRVESMTELARSYLRARGLRRPLLRMPMPGRMAADFRAGGHLLGSDGERGTRTFADYLRERVHPERTAELPYQLKGRLRSRRPGGAEVGGSSPD